MILSMSEMFLSGNSVGSEQLPYKQKVGGSSPSPRTIHGHNDWFVCHANKVEIEGSRPSPWTKRYAQQS